MTCKGIVVSSALTLLSAVAHAGSAPKELYGKSIIVAWNEARSQRELGEANFRDRLVPITRTIYFSTKGQWFVRIAAGSNAHQSIGASATTGTGGVRQIQFSGRTITYTTADPGGMARRMTIEFNESFTTCEVHVIFAKQAGHDVVIGHNLVTGAADKEIRSATVSSSNCSVHDGNVFAQ
jgi:hypothetical protein